MAMLAGNFVTQPLHFSRQTMESTDGSISMDSSDNFDRESINIDNTSCCSDDTVLSVGNETPVSACKSEILSFKNIENHLNAISHITNSTLKSRHSDRESSSPVNSLLSPSSTKSSSSSFCFRTESVKNSPAISNFLNQNNHKDTSEDDANNVRLKFSIDNILKADFGRRITDPINIRKSLPKRVIPEGVEDAGKSSGPVDLSKGEDKEKKEEKQPILWPAWVYCTRYSDRPSSGIYSFPMMYI
ncbi:homeobox protein invected-like [Leptinotarsa decemlineata]|uniref:homeobox protein invected-like n=1 Tax=Leptinotarsa decemlineata TaxID=7539 RepID=UPI003D30B0F1